VTSGLATVNNSNSTLTITGAGPVVVQATQGGNGTYSAATPVSASFAASPALPFNSCVFTLTSTTTTPSTVTTLTDMPVSAYYGDTVTISGCAAPNPATPVTYALVGTGLKSTLSSGIVSFKATESVAVRISAAASTGHPAVSWISAATTVALRPLTVLANSPTWTYGLAPTTAHANLVNLSVAAGTARLAFPTDVLPTTIAYTTITNASSTDVMASATPTNYLPIGSYTVTPAAWKIQVGTKLAYYAITPVAGTLTVDPSNASGAVKAGAATVSLSGIEVSTQGQFQVLVHNNSGETLNIGASLPSGSPWTVSPASGCATTSGSGGACTLTVSYTAPSTVGAVTSQLAITATDALSDGFTGTTYTVAPVTLKLTAVQ
jgi:hypothetical protein